MLVGMNIQNRQASVGIRSIPSNGNVKVNPMEEFEESILEITLYATKEMAADVQALDNVKVWMDLVPVLEVSSGYKNPAGDAARVEIRLVDVLPVVPSLAVNEALKVGVLAVDAVVSSTPTVTPSPRVV